VFELSSRFSEPVSYDHLPAAEKKEKERLLFLELTQSG
jgi:hypothetical protein